MKNLDPALHRLHPEADPAEAVDHPAGDVRLRAGAGLGLRAHLLAGGDASFPPVLDFPTMTVPI